MSYKGHIGWAYNKYLLKASSPDVPTEFSGELFCIGTEPHWTLKSQGYRLILKKYDKSELYLLDSSIEKSKNETDIRSLNAVHSKINGNSFSMIVKRDELCSDDMSDDKYTYSITINDHNNGLLSGCCK